MKRKLFCEMGPFFYALSVAKGRFFRYLQWIQMRRGFAVEKSEDPLPVSVYKHSSLIRRTLGGVDPVLQQNKETNLKLTIPKINGILIRPGETFSFWYLAGNCKKSRGYLPGLVIRGGKPSVGIGGGMCQFTNLIHWMILHSPLQITEHHHHNQFDLFPDFGRKVPFGTGTSIFYNYLDYQFRNDTDTTFQLLITDDGRNLCGELRCDHPGGLSYHIAETGHCFAWEDGVLYRINEIHRHVFDRVTGNLLKDEFLIRNHSRVLYDPSYIPEEAFYVKTS